jgi:hypothetical protein
MEMLSQEDPATLGLEAVLAEWNLALGTTDHFTSQQVLDRANVMIGGNFHAALVNAAGMRNGQLLAKGLTGYLEKIKGRPRGGFAIRGDKYRNTKVWRLVRV